MELKNLRCSFFVVDKFLVKCAADIVFDYRQKATRKFEYLQGDYYIAPAFLVSLFLIHIQLLWFA